MEMARSRNLCRLVHRRYHHPPSTRREFDPIVQQVEDDPLQPVSVGRDRRQGGRDVGFQGDVAMASTPGDQGHGIVGDSADVHGTAVQFQPPALQAAALGFHNELIRPLKEIAESLCYSKKQKYFFIFTLNSCEEPIKIWIKRVRVHRPGLSCHQPKLQTAILAEYLQ